MFFLNTGTKGQDGLIAGNEMLKGTYEDHMISLRPTLQTEEDRAGLNGKPLKCSGINNTINIIRLEDLDVLLFTNE